MSCLTIIVAATKLNGIGVKGGLPWRLPKEMKYFAQVTSKAPEGSQNVVIMGRNTWESIPKKFRPLPKRLNVVISRNASYDLTVQDNSVVLRDSLPSAISLFSQSGAPSAATDLHRAFIIGGASLYAEALALPLASSPAVKRVLLTRVLSPEYSECDVYMEDFANKDSNWTRSTHAALENWVGFQVPEGEQEENGVKYEFQMWERE